MDGQSDVTEGWIDPLSKCLGTSDLLKVDKKKSVMWSFSQWHHHLYGSLHTDGSSESIIIIIDLISSSSSIINLKEV